MLLLILGTEVPPSQHQDHRVPSVQIGVLGLQRAQSARTAKVVYQLKVGEDGAGHDVRSHIHAPMLEVRAARL